jgi:hypothetical protein
MTCTLSIPLEIIAVVHDIEGGGYWAVRDMKVLNRLPFSQSPSVTLKTSGWF